MVSPTLDGFVDRARTGNLIPVYRDILADLETPVSAYLKLGGRPHSFLLESVAGGEQISRYSFIGGEPFLVMKTWGRELEITRDGRSERRTLDEGEDPLHVLKALMGGLRFVKDPDLPPFCGGAVGYIGYDTVRFFEQIPESVEDDRGLPDCYFVFTDTLLIFDHVSHRLKVLCLAQVDGDAEAAYRRALAKIDELVTQLRRPLALPGALQKSSGDLQRLASEAEAHVEAERRTPRVDDETVVGPIVRLAHGILKHAIQAEATAVHLDAGSRTLVIRYLKEAEVLDEVRLPRYLYDNLSQRYKVMAGCSFTEGRHFDDARISVSSGGHDYDFILGFSPTVYGERAVLRVRPLPADDGAPAPGSLVTALAPREPGELQVTSVPSREEHEAAIERAKEYIRAGDIIQVVLSRRMQVEVSASPIEIYRALRSVNPSPYMFFLQFEDCQLIGASPEILVTERAGSVVTRPIAGTVRRGKTLEEDAALEAQLLADPKERAEHIMLVDLHRNDIGRVCEFGSVVVDQLMVTEKYSHVIHIVSNVVGKLRPDKDAFDLIRAAFPAGTLSGAPKIRAMEIIDELEPVKRGPYGGAIGYFSFSGDMDTAITLRTIVMKDRTAYVQAGGGIVADSDPAAEYQETVSKAGALLRAIELAERGLE